MYDMILTVRFTYIDIIDIRFCGKPAWQSQRVATTWLAAACRLFLHLWVQVQLSGPNPSVETLPETLPPDFPSRQ